jgi:predicted dehydrogenase
MTQINVGVIGVGRWGVHWLRVVSEHPSAKLVAVVDPNLQRLETVKKQYQLDDNVILTTDWQALQQIQKIDAVIIATPAATHYSLIADALKWGFHVLAEKPLTLDPDECRSLCQLAEHRVLMVDHTYLFHPAVERGKVAIEAGEIGDLRYGYATRTHLGPVRQDVDALWDLAIHDIAIFNTWLGKLPVKVQANGTVWLQGGQGGQGEVAPPQSFPSPKSPLHDLVWVTLTYADGFQAYIHLCWLNNDKQRRLGVVGSRGSLIFDEMSVLSPLTLNKGEFELRENQYIPINQTQQVLELEKAEPLKQVCSYFLNCIQTNTPPAISSGWVGTELVEILTALTRSLQQGGVPILVGSRE